MYGISIKNMVEKVPLLKIFYSNTVQTVKHGGGEGIVGAALAATETCVYLRHKNN